MFSTESYLKYSEGLAGTSGIQPAATIIQKQEVKVQLQTWQIHTCRSFSSSFWCEQSPLFELMVRLQQRMTLIKQAVPRKC